MKNTTIVTSNVTRKLARVIGVSSIAIIPAIALPVFAIERPSEQDGPQPQKAQKESVDQEGNLPDAQQKKAMLGVGGSSASKTLSLHLGLAEGAGLTLFHIIPDSAADKAGLKPHDVITGFAGKPVGSQQDLRAAIDPYHPGDEVSVKFIHQGKAVEKKVILGELPKQLEAMRDRGIHPRWMFKGLGGQIPEGQRKLMAEQMKQNMEKLKLKLKNQGGLELRPGIDQNSEPGKKRPQQLFNLNASSSITMSDGKGSVTMKSTNGQKEIMVKDEQGEIIFEGPYNTAQDKAALPDDIRDRVSQFNFGENDGKGFHFKVMPGALVAPPVPNEDAAAQ